MRRRGASADVSMRSLYWTISESFNARAVGLKVDYRKNIILIVLDARVRKVRYATKVDMDDDDHELRRRKNEKFMMELGADIADYYGHTDVYWSSACDIFKLAMRRAVGATMNTKEWTNVLNDGGSGLPMYDTCAVLKCINYRKDCRDPVLNKVIPHAFRRLHERFARFAPWLSWSQWDRIVASYALVAHMATNGRQRNDYSDGWREMGELAARLLADEYRDWFVAHDWTEFVAGIYECRADDLPMALRVKDRSYFWKWNARNAQFGANVQFFHHWREGSNNNARRLLDIMNTVMNFNPPFVDYTESTPDWSIEIRRVAGDSVLAIRPFYHYACWSPNSIRDDATHFVVVGDDERMPDARLEPYTRRFDVVAFRREFEPHWARVLRAAKIGNGEPLIAKLSASSDDEFLREVKRILTTFYKYDLSVNDRAIICSELARAMGAYSLTWTADSQRWSTTDDGAPDAFPIRSSPFRLLADCVSYIGSGADVTLQKLAALAALRAGNLLTSVPEAMRRKLLRNAKMT